MKVLVTGATGYVGGRLVPRLIERTDCDVRVLVRDSSRIDDRGWNGIEICEGDALQETVVQRALEGVHTAYYLIHSMAAGEHGFASRDKDAAEIFGRVARQQGVSRIIYLGGLGSVQDKNLSLHLASRLETGDQLRQGGVPVIEFRAGMIIGSGSLSFEMLRYLSERVPVMVAPRWIKTRSQPIAIRDVLSYLIGALDLSPREGEIYEIGGPDVVSYDDMIRAYSAERSLKRFIIQVPVLTPRLSSYWINLVTPLPASLARPLVEGLKNELLVTSRKALTDFKIHPIPFREAIRLALERTYSQSIETRWSSALSSSAVHGTAFKLTEHEGLITEERSLQLQVSAPIVFKTLLSIGGDNGWPYANFLWQIRGWIDRLFGGVGLRRGRRSQTELKTSEALDFWRVEAVQKDRLLRLRAEMKVPGKAWLEFRIDSQSEGCQLTQRAIFEPKGLLGIIYWYGIYPLHKIIFKGMIEGIATLANKTAQK